MEHDNISAKDIKNKSQHDTGENISCMKYLMGKVDLKQVVIAITIHVQ